MGAPTYRRDSAAIRGRYASTTAVRACSSPALAASTSALSGLAARRSASSGCAPIASASRPGDPGAGQVAVGAPSAGRLRRESLALGTVERSVVVHGHALRGEWAARPVSPYVARFATVRVPRRSWREAPPPQEIVRVRVRGPRRRTVASSPDAEEIHPRRRMHRRVAVERRSTELAGPAGTAYCDRRTSFRVPGVDRMKAVVYRGRLPARRVRSWRPLAVGARALGGGPAAARRARRAVRTGQARVVSEPAVLAAGTVNADFLMRVDAPLRRGASLIAQQLLRTSGDAPATPP